MVSRQMAKGEGKTVALHQTEVHDNEEKCKIQAYIRVTILQMTGKKTLHNADQEHYIRVKGSS